MKKTIALALAVILALVCCCFASAEEGPRFVTIGEWLQAEGDCGDCILAVQVTQIHNPVLAVGTDETGSVNLFSGNGEDSMIINFMSDECPQEGAVLVIANPRYNVFDGIVEMADWTLLRVLPLTIEGGEAGEAVIPEELVGTWQGTGTPKNNGSPIDLVVTIGADGTGEYFFDQGGYHENNPISISYEGNSFTVNTDESMLGGCEGTWSLEDGVLTLDITSTLPGGSTYSYIAECTKAAEEKSAAGRWVIEELTVDGVEYPPDVMGMTWIFELREDGTARMMQETKQEKHEGTGTWQQSGDVLLITVEGTGLSATVADDRLTIDDDNVLAVFVQETAAGEEEPAAAEESPAGKGGPEEGISWGMSLDEVKGVKAAQQKGPGGMHLSEDNLGGRPVLFCMVLRDPEDGEAVISSYFFDAESGGLIFAYYSFEQPIEETWKNLLAEYDAVYTGGGRADIGELYSLMAEMVPEDDFSGYLPPTAEINSWKDETGTGIWMACAASDGILMTFRACPELAESIR